MTSRNVALLALTVMLSACADCGSNPKAQALARGLSEQRLSQLFDDLESHAAGHYQAPVHMDRRTGIPAPFQDLEPRSIAIDGSTAVVHLSGCVDDKVLLVARGVGHANQRKIVLLPGEEGLPTTLWEPR
jgi:hypothetical protein